MNAKELRDAVEALMDILRLHAEAVMSAGKPTSDMVRTTHEILGDMDAVIYSYKEGRNEK